MGEETKAAATTIDATNYWYSVGWFLALLGLLALLRKRLASSNARQQSAIVTGEFKKFQQNYIAVFLIMMGADWLQGPYVYALYKHYGFDISEIGRLFIMGFGASLIFGTIVGSAADKYGRKRLCLVFGLCYGLSCLTKHSSNFNVLMGGRVMGGVATSILFSSFESWMVHEHHEQGYPEEWLGMTFAVCTSGNGIVAIASGVIASFVREQFGPVAPFDTSLVFLLIGTGLVFFNWNENYGDSQIDMKTTLNNAWTRMVGDRKIVLLGLIQSFFEGAMYIFVFMWTPALESTTEHPLYHGWIFGSFMICVWIGSYIFGVLLERGYRVEQTTFYMFLIAAVSLAVSGLVQVHTVRLVAFFVFEGCVGMFWPSLGFMRSRYVPEEVRATTMNFFRVPLNLIVVVVLANIGGMTEFMVFATCVVCLLPALVCQFQLNGLTLSDAANRRTGEGTLIGSDAGTTAGAPAGSDAANAAQQSQPLTAGGAGVAMTDLSGVAGASSAAPVPAAST